MATPKRIRKRVSYPWRHRPHITVSCQNPGPRIILPPLISADNFYLYNLSDITSPHQTICFETVPTCIAIYCFIPKLAAALYAFEIKKWLLHPAMQSLSIAMNLIPILATMIRSGFSARYILVVLVQMDISMRFCQNGRQWKCLTAHLFLRKLTV